MFIPCANTSYFSKKAFFNEYSISVMAWPSRSPDLNPIENLWGYLVRAVYPSGKQYFDVISLKKEILRQWSLISEEYCKKLVASRHKRCLDVISKNRSKTKY